MKLGKKIKDDTSNITLDENTKETTTNASNEDEALDISEFTSGLNFEHSEEKFHDNMSTAITFFLCGIAGIVLLVLNWFGKINIITGKNVESLIIYGILLVLFVIFIGIAVYSVVVAKKVKGKIKSENNYVDEIKEWINNNIIPEVVDASYDGKDLPTEIKYFERSSFITRAVVSKFPDAPRDLVDNIVDEYIEEMFHTLERALLKEAEADEADEINETPDESDNNN